MTLRLAGLFAVAVCAAAASLLVGGVNIAPAAVFGALFHPWAHGEIATILWQLRLPRVCIAAFVGASLAIGGALLQGMLRNPLVDPYLTGVSAGAAAATAICISAGVAAAAIPALGFAAGLGTALLVAALARRGSGVDSNRLILAGVSLSTFFSAIVTLVLVRAQSANAATAIVAWLAGSMAGRGWLDLEIAMPYAFVGVVLSALAAPALDALRAGDVRARSVGVEVARVQWIILAAASLLAAASVVLAGLVGFIGLIVPHVARRLVGSQARALLPACALLGAALCTLADAAARSLIPPTELPIGVLLAFIGVPSFLYLYLKGGISA